jgi:hypothetical protein
MIVRLDASLDHHLDVLQRGLDGACRLTLPDVASRRVQAAACIACAAVIVGRPGTETEIGGTLLAPRHR